MKKHTIVLTEAEIDLIVGWGGVRSVEWDLEPKEKELWNRLRKIIRRDNE